MRISASLLLAVCLAVVGTHVWGALEPSHMNWGAHFFGFYDSKVGWLSVLIACLTGIPRLQRVVIKGVEKSLQKLSVVPIPIIFTMVAGALVAGSFYFPAKLHLLGDGALLLRSLSNAEWGPNIQLSFYNQPLMYFLFRQAEALNIIASSSETYGLYMWIDRVAGVCFLVLIFLCMRSFRASLTEKVMLACVLLFAAGSQFFFGYVENYVLQYVCTMAFVLSGWFAL